MKKTEETSEKPGATLISSRAGRIVLAVEWHAPETMPSASPCTIIMVPKYDGSARSTSRAFCRVMPLCLRFSNMASTIASPHAVGASVSTRSGSTTCAPSRETCAASASCATAACFPRSVSVHRPRARSSAAAVTTRMSSPSGSTMCCLCERADKKMLCLKIIGETSCPPASCTIASTNCGSKCSSISASTASSFDIEPRSRRRCSAEASGCSGSATLPTRSCISRMRDAASKEVNGVSSTGMPIGGRPSSTLEILNGRLSALVSSTPGWSG
mmetsp:Transcript_36349/g.77511  ORF Transcript_36349/g.77511 Transcript_36349/m.77511 type:complete len:272 (-) Transcript_36349:347-1162(-)